MRRATSLYLDIVRFVAALTVFFGHASYGKWTGGLFWQFSQFGSRSVDVFFVLSGFVIAYVVDAKEFDARTYAASRMARIYSVALPALLLTFCLNWAGQSIDAAPYISMTDHVSNQVVALFANAGFVNEIWNWHLVFGSNEPYWSMGFEVWYYVIFGIFVFAPGRWRVPGVIAALAMAGPKIVILFPLWLAGVGCYAVTRARRLGPVAGCVMFAGSVVLLFCYFTWFPQHEIRQFDPISFEPARLASYLNNYVTGCLFVLNIIGFDAMSVLFEPLLVRLSRPIRWVAGASFSLYLFHQPVLEFLVALSPQAPSSVLTRVLVIVGTPCVVFVLAEFTERRKSGWRRLFLWLLGGGRSLMGAPGPAPAALLSPGPSTAKSVITVYRRDFR